MGHRTPLVSVVTIVKNDRAGFLSTLASVRAQQAVDDIEHVVVDGASTDGTAEAVRAQAGSLTRWVSEPDAGISDAFNKALALARGRWLNFLNAGDTYADSGVLARVAPLLREDGHAIVTGYSVTAGVRSPPYPIRNHERLARRAWLSHQGSFIHRRVFDACGGFDLRFRVRMDYELWLRALPRFSFMFVEGPPLVTFAPGGVSTRMRREFFAEEFAANRLHLRFPAVANLRVRARERLHAALRATRLFDVYRALRLPSDG